MNVQAHHVVIMVDALMWRMGTTAIVAADIQAHIVRLASILRGVPIS